MHTLISNQSTAPNQAVFNCQTYVNADHVEVVVNGITAIQQIRQCYVDGFDLAKKHKLKRILIDVRNSTIAYHSLEILLLMKQLTSDYKRFKVARLIPTQGHKQLLIQQIANQQNLAWQNFECASEASNWLR